MHLYGLFARLIMNVYLVMIDCLMVAGVLDAPYIYYIVVIWVHNLILLMSLPIVVLAHLFEYLLPACGRTSISPVVVYMYQLCTCLMRLVKNENVNHNSIANNLSLELKTNKMAFCPMSLLSVNSIFAMMYCTYSNCKHLITSIICNCLASIIVLTVVEFAAFVAMNVPNDSQAH